MRGIIKMQVAEKFVSIDGEGPHAGELAAFIRFKGCNLDCDYCDTKWANRADCAANDETAEDLAAWVQSTGTHNVTLTGGEPLLQKDIAPLIARLTETGHRVEIETNGSVSVEALSLLTPRPVFTLDYKLPGSGMESAMLTENYRYLAPGDSVKFVSGSREDLERAAEIIGKYRLTEKCAVFISPVFGKIDPADIVAFLLERRLNGVRLQLQLHKFIWDPNKRGV